MKCSIHSSSTGSVCRNQMRLNVFVVSHILLNKIYSTGKFVILWHAWSWPHSIRLFHMLCPIHTARNVNVIELKLIGFYHSDEEKNRLNFFFSISLFLLHVITYIACHHYDWFNVVQSLFHIQFSSVGVEQPSISISQVNRITKRFSLTAYIFIQN